MSGSVYGSRSSFTPVTMEGIDVIGKKFQLRGAQFEVTGESVNSWEIEFADDATVGQFSKRLFDDAKKMGDLHEIPDGEAE